MESIAKDMVEMFRNNPSYVDYIARQNGLIRATSCAYLSHNKFRSVGQAVRAERASHAAIL